MIDLIYDLKLDKVIEVYNIDIVINTNNRGYLAIDMGGTTEIKMVVKKDVSWAADWFSSIYNNNSEFKSVKRDIHVSGYNLMLHGCYLKSYSSIQVGESEIIIGCDYHIRVDKDSHKNFYRDKKIEELFS